MTALVDTVTSHKGSDSGVIVALEVHELLTKIHNFLDNAVSKWIGNTSSSKKATSTVFCYGAKLYALTGLM